MHGRTSIFLGEASWKKRDCASEVVSYESGARAEKGLVSFSSGRVGSGVIEKLETLLKCLLGQQHLLSSIFCSCTLKLTVDDTKVVRSFCNDAGSGRGGEYST